MNTTLQALCVLSLSAHPAASQNVIDDFECRTAMAATNANPTVLTCNEPHGYTQRPAEATINFVNTPVQSGLTISIDGIVYTYDASLNNSLPYHILLSSSKVENAKRLVAAINDTGVGKGTLYSIPTMAHRTNMAERPTYASSGMVINTTADTVTWKSHGMQTGDPFTVSCSNANLATVVPPFAFYTTYYAIVVDADTFRVASSLANAQNGVYLDLTTSQGGNFMGLQASCAGCAPEWAPDNANVAVIVHSRTAGLSGAGKAVASSNTLQASWNRATTQIVFPVYITGATAPWAGLGSDATPKGYLATAISDIQFSVPFNSTSLGSFSGQDIRIVAANGDLTRKTYVDNSTVPANESRVSANHALAVVVHSCEPAMNDVECSKGYWTPDNQKAYMADAKIDTFVVSGSTITISLKAAYVDGSGYPHMAVTQLIHVRGFQQYATSTNPGYAGTPNAVAQSTAALFAKNSVRGFRVLTFSSDRKTVTITNPGLVDGVYVGTCLPAGVCVGRTQAEPFITITSPASPYIYTTPRSGGYLWPKGYQWWNTKNPLSFDPASNRFRFWVRFGKNILMPSQGAYNYNWGTYPQTVTQDTSGGGSHFYYQMALNTYQNSWQLLEMTCAPNHEVGAAGGINWPNEVLKGHGYYPAWKAGPRSCMEGEELFYQDFVNRAPWDWSGQTLYYAGFEFDKTDGEPEEGVRGRSAVWAPQRFSGGQLTGGPGYDVMWSSPSVSGITYQIRYSTTASLKTAGWASGTDGGTVVPPGVSLGYSGVLWQSPDMPQADDFWVGIRPKFPLVGTTGAGASPLWVIARSETDLTPGDTVNVTGVLGNTAANQTNGTVVAMAPRQYFWRFQPQRELGGALPGGLAGIDAAGGKCVARFTVPHGLSAGWVIEVVGSPSQTLGGVPTMTPKLYTITSVLDTQSFAFNCSGVADGTYDKDNAPGVHFVIIALPGVAIAGTGTGTYGGGGGTLISTSNQHGFAEIHLPRFQPYGSIPVAPANLTAAVSGPDLTLTWQDRSNDENDFVVERRSGTDSYQTVAVTEENATSYTDPGMPTGVVYYYRVHARNAVGDSDYSNEASAEVPVPPAPPKAPANLRR